MFYHERLITYTYLIMLLVDRKWLYFYLTNLLFVQTFYGNSLHADYYQQIGVQCLAQKHVGPINWGQGNKQHVKIIKKY